VLPFSSAYTSQSRLLCSSMSDEVGLNFILRSESIDPFFNICLNHTVLKTLVPKRSQTNVQICEISHLIETSTTWKPNENIWFQQYTVVVHYKVN